MFVEALIAAAIVAMALVATFRVIGDGATRDRRAEARRAALMVAQSELAAVGSEIPLAAGRTSGVVQDLVWRVSVSRYAAEGGGDPAGALWKVVVAVQTRAGGPDLVTLSSLRLGPEA